DVGAFRAAVARFDRRMTIEAPGDVRAATETRVDVLTAEARDWLTRSPRFFASGQPLDTTLSTGSELLADDLRRFLRERRLLDIEEGFAAQYVRNPYSGELIKGHRIAIAELGLVPYTGNIVRDPGLFDGSWSKARRAEHIVSRIAFV